MTTRRGLSLITRAFIPRNWVALGTAIGVASLTATAPAAWACNSDSYIGTICATAATFCPDGTLPADGKIYNIAQYQALYALIGSTFGGNGQTTFAVPDLQGRSIIGAGAGKGLSIIDRGQQRGTETVTQTVSTLAPHTHLIEVSEVATGEGMISVIPGAATSGTNTPVAGATYQLGGIGGRAQDGPYTDVTSATDPAIVTGVTVTLSDLGAEAAPTGGGQPQTNIPPQLGLLYCIVLEGVFPPRPDY